MVIALKEDLRRELLGKRLSVSHEEVCALSLLVGQRFVATEEFADAERMALYCGFKNEVLTDHIFSEAKRQGKTLYYPRVDTEGLTFHRVDSLKELSPGSHDIPEPSTQNHSMPPEELHCIVIPGVAFDIRGARLGYGKGYYDRTLKDTGARKVALAFDFQVVDFIPLQSWDVRVDCIVTEKRIIRV